MVDNFIKKQKFDRNDVRLLKDEFFEQLDDSMIDVEIELGGPLDSIDRSRNDYDPPQDKSYEKSTRSASHHEEPEITAMS